MKKLILFLFATTALIFILIKVMGSSNRAFDQDFWKENPDKRHLMSKNIVETELLIGRDKQEVSELLTKECKHCSNTDNSWMYYTKVEQGWRNYQIEIMDVVFIDGKVSEVSLREFR